MSEEERDLLARIGQLAGQINRHRSQQAGVGAAPSRQPNSYRRGNAYHPASAYNGSAYRVGRPHNSHRHRTLHLNQSRPASDSNTPSPGSTPGSTGWVSRNDRHRQLINANVYEKETQNRAKAMEETRQKKFQGRKQREKTQLKDFLRHQASATDATTNSTPGTGRNEIIIEGIRFHVADGGKKLVKSADQYSATPKTAVVAGVRFQRTKSGNMVANRIVQDQRRSGVQKKVSQPCKAFSTTGSCPKGPTCRYQHDPTRVAVCKDLLKDGKCPNGESCDLSHDLTPERVPNCLHYAKGHCTKPDCPYTHSRAAPGALVCESFGFYGYCDRGAACTERHVFECPDFSNTGVCKNKGCKLLHRERASVLRNQAKADEAMDDDVSSDEEPVDSDDVDSDEVAELIEAESDDSDFENQKDFIPL
ncbi:zinc finger domain-containing protein [Pochonia chlamydosporia 170]|uniref:Zinc finger domain-containing protein n=1 Tax=Pochonia chlamydosporia 170 TaxID=1380566 RepID=A0A179G4G9_METCM|nr:zinc finger domain-containing protein [Pochonia chlamydosporia 170]OAQ72420.2 zinc finger domain-containing protein [Pochonia chlamydosporia 170]